VLFVDNIIFYFPFMLKKTSFINAQNFLWINLFWCSLCINSFRLPVWQANIGMKKENFFNRVCIAIFYNTGFKLECKQRCLRNIDLRCCGQINPNEYFHSLNPKSLQLEFLLSIPPLSMIKIFFYEKRIFNFQTLLYQVS